MVVEAALLAVSPGVSQCHGCRHRLCLRITGPSASRCCPSRPPSRRLRLPAERLALAGAGAPRRRSGASATAEGLAGEGRSESFPSRAVTLQRRPWLLSPDRMQLELQLQLAEDRC